MSFEISRRVFLGSLPLRLVLTAAGSGETHVGCQANAWPLKVGDFAGLLRVFRKARELGYVGCECNVRFVQDEFSRAADVRKAMEATGVQFIGPHTSMANSKSEAFAGVAAGAAALGAQRVVMSGTGLSPEGTFEATALKEKATELERLGKICRQNGIRLAYHNHNPEFANHNAEIEALAKSTSAELVDLLMDAGHGYLGGGNPAEFMSRNSSRIFGCHVKTFHGKDEQKPLGQGDFGFEALAAAIKETGWKGWIISEEGGNPRYANNAALGPDRAYIRKVFGV
jgi:sugar phosphate isomerase/epimerase